MKVNGFTLYKTNEFHDCNLIIKNGEVVEYNSGFIKDIFPKENKSALSKVDEILNVHRPERIPNNCKYYIQHSINGEVLNIYLDVNKMEYFRLKWQLKEYLIQTKEFKKGVLIAIIVFALGLVSYWIKKTYIDSPMGNTNQQIIKPNIVPNKAPKKEAENDLKKDTLTLESDIEK